MRNLGDLPPELITLIADGADIRSLCSLRNCSKPLRQIVINSKNICEQIIVEHTECYQVSIQVNHNSTCVYAAKTWGCEIQKQQPSGNIKTFLEGESYLELAVDDLMKILKDPKIVIGKLEIRRSLSRTGDIDPFFKLLSQTLNQLSRRLHVEKFTPWNLTESDMIGILPCFKPGTLRVLDLSPNGVGQSDRLREIVHLEQWKQARELRSSVVPPLGELLHFERVEVQFLGCPLIVPWNELKSFIEKVMAQAEPMQFKCHGVQIPNELSLYTRSFQQIGGTDKFVLKELENGNKLVLIRHDNYIKINKYGPYQ